ncbi:MAG: DHHA1 domain-containing protein [Candidatus Nanoarchaeia archaeon]
MKLFSKLLGSKSKLSSSYKKAREFLLSCERPLFFFDDDPDGLSSFLLLYRFTKCGRGMAIKGAQLQSSFKRQIDSYQPDALVILDKASVEEDFFEDIDIPVLWIDHHELQRPPKNVLYINSRQEKHDKPTAWLAYQIVKQDPWLATVGIVSDWQLPEKSLRKQTQDILPDSITKPQVALFNSQAGELARIFAFNLKGSSKDIVSSIKMLSRINSPFELLEEQHAQARLLIKRYKQRQNEYESLKQQVVVDANDPLLLFEYQENKNSYTADLSNELLYRYPKKCILIARHRADRYVCSLRYSQKNIEKILQDVLEITGGNGGGHEHACGAQIPEDQWATFLDELRKRI